jgi:hypothetical protein
VDANFYFRPSNFNLTAIVRCVNMGNTNESRK